ncbi:MAG: hypothetical protein H7201_09005 [Candidatus Saccharibacteria bacterium]|nr:hypothetical protein [Microbacteriaceae bacterium]
MRLSEPDDPRLDDSIESLDAVNAWFLARTLEPREAETADLPSWWNPARPTAESGLPGSGPFTSTQLALIDEMQAYVAAVMTTAHPDAKWVMYKGHKLESRNGQTMLQIGNSRPFPVRSAIYNEALNAFVYCREVPVKQLSELVRTALAG